MPAALHPRRRKRRFPERELLDRVRKYESLLRRNKIDFDPLHEDDTFALGLSRTGDEQDLSDQRAEFDKDRSPSPAAGEKLKEPHEIKYVF